MPRLQHQPPKYRLHKGSGQAIASLDGRRKYLGKYGSDESRQRYQELVEEWNRLRRGGDPEEPLSPAAAEETLAEVVTPQSLRAKRRDGVRITLDELIFVYRRHAQAVWSKNSADTNHLVL